MTLVRDISVVLGLAVSLGTFVCVTVPSLRKRLADLLLGREAYREELKNLRLLVEQHVGEDAAKKADLALQREVDRCVLRDLITATYYRYVKEKKIPVYAMENVSALYELYQKRGGNSYVQSLMRQIQEEWEVLA